MIGEIQLITMHVVGLAYGSDNANNEFNSKLKIIGLKLAGFDLLINRKTFHPKESCFFNQTIKFRTPYKYA